MKKKDSSDYFGEKDREDYFDKRFFSTDTGDSVQPKLIYTSLFTTYQETPSYIHSHQHLEILYVAKGSCKVCINDKLYELGKSDLAVFNKNVIHYEIKSNEADNEIYYLAMTNVNLVHSLPKDTIIDEDTCPVASAAADAAQFSMLFRELLYEIKNKNSYHSLLTGNLATVILIKVIRLIRPELETSSRISEDCKSIIDFINNNYQNDINLDVIARSVFLSKHYMSHLFKEQLNISPIKYLINKRISEAKKLLLNTNLPIVEIARRVGYPDTIYFSQLFKKSENVSPTKFRQLLKP